MQMETDLERIGELAAEREDENLEFRSFLKGYDGGDLDERVHRILQNVCAHIDCTTCANCCTIMKTEVSGEDIARLCKGLSITPEEFQERYLEPSDEDGRQMIRELPCPFLKDKRCTVYDDRPEDCRSYPHLHKDEFVTRLLGVVSNCEVCPIVFNVYEQLKGDLGFRSRRRRRRRRW